MINYNIKLFQLRLHKNSVQIHLSMHNENNSNSSLLNKTFKKRLGSILFESLKARCNYFQLNKSWYSALFQVCVHLISAITMHCLTLERHTKSIVGHKGIIIIQLKRNYVWQNHGKHSIFCQNHIAEAGFLQTSLYFTWEMNLFSFTIKRFLLTRMLCFINVCGEAFSFLSLLELFHVFSWIRLSVAMDTDSLRNPLLKKELIGKTLHIFSKVVSLCFISCDLLNLSHNRHISALYLINNKLLCSCLHKANSHWLVKHW